MEQVVAGCWTKVLFIKEYILVLELFICRKYLRFVIYKCYPDLTRGPF